MHLLSALSEEDISDTSSVCDGCKALHGSG